MTSSLGESKKLQFLYDAASKRRSNRGGREGSGIGRFLITSFMNDP